MKIAALITTCLFIILPQIARADEINFLTKVNNTEQSALSNASKQKILDWEDQKFIKQSLLVHVAIAALNKKTIHIKIDKLDEEFNEDKTGQDKYNLHSWEGRGTRSPVDTAAFVWQTGSLGITGTIRSGGFVYEIRYLQGDIHVLMEERRDVHPLPDRPASEFPPEVQDHLKRRSTVVSRYRNSAGNQISSTASTPVIKILFAYTADASREANIAQTAEQELNDMNSVLAGSGVNLQVSLAGIVPSAFVENQSRDEYAPLLYVMNERSVMAARDSTNADVVVLFADIDPNIAGGRAFKTWADTPNQAYADVSINPICSNAHGSRMKWHTSSAQTTTRQIQQSRATCSMQTGTISPAILRTAYTPLASIR